MEDIIEVKEEIVVDSFTLSDLKNQVDLLNQQIQNEIDACQTKVSAIEAERQGYIDKIATYEK